MEFYKFHAGTSEDPGAAPREIAKQNTHENRYASNHNQRDVRAPNRYNASVKVRNYETVHYPEYKGWHNREPTPLNAAWTWKPEPGNGLPVNPKTRVSRGPNYRVSENCGFAWDPGASYGPETIAALPTADDKLKEDLFDETQDQATDGVPDTGIFAFGSTANKRNNS